MGATMGKSGGNFLDALPSQGALHVVMLGLDSAGKTTALYRLKFDQYLNTVPTIGFNCEKVQGTVGKAKGVQFLVWDVGGQEKLRPLWRSYTRCTDGILFVVDSVDVERMEEAKMELMRTARCPDNQGVPVLILANKQDLPGARDPKELEKLLGLHELQFPNIQFGGVSMHTSSSAPSGNIVDYSTVTNHNSCQQQQQKSGRCSTNNYEMGRNLTPTYLHSHSFGGYGLNVSDSTSITKDLYMQNATNVSKNLYSNSARTLNIEPQNSNTDNISNTLKRTEFIYESKTTPSSTATTPIQTIAPQPPQLSYSQTNALSNVPMTTGMKGLNKNMNPGNTNTNGKSCIVTAISTAHSLQYKGWYIQPACAITGEGLQEGLEALYELILKKRKISKAYKKKR